MFAASMWGDGPPLVLAENERYDRRKAGLAAEAVARDLDATTATTAGNILGRVRLAGLVAQRPVTVAQVVNGGGERMDGLVFSRIYAISLGR